MSTQQSEEYLTARRESCKLLGLNADDLSPHEMIRADLLTVLRLWLDSSQSTLIAGGSADPTKILAVADVLGKLVPEPEHKASHEDPRAYMWRTYLEMRRRGELAESYLSPQQRLEAARAKVAEIEAEISALAPPPDDAPPAPAAPDSDPPSNVVPLSRPPTERTDERSSVSPSPPAAPVYGDLVDVVHDPISDPRSYVLPDGNISPTPFGGSRRWWGPV